MLGLGQGCYHLGEEGAAGSAVAEWGYTAYSAVDKAPEASWERTQDLHLPTWSRLLAVRTKLPATDITLVLWMEILTLLNDLTLKKPVDLRQGGRGCFCLFWRVDRMKTGVK